MIWLRYALWASAAGALIAVMALLNARLSESLLAPAQAPVVLFAVALASALIASLALTGRLPSPDALRATAPVNLFGGVIVAFYVLSITMFASAAKPPAIWTCTRPCCAKGCAKWRAIRDRRFPVMQHEARAAGD